MHAPLTIVERPAEVPAALRSLHPVLARVLASRGVDDPTALDLRFAQLLKPDGLAQIERALALLVDAIRTPKRIVICGDYDADGATALTIMVRALRALGAADVHWRVPNRFEHGYGLSPEFVDSFRDLAPALLITVDHGTTSVSGVALAKVRGFSVLITDHHLPGDTLPDADALINPNLPGDEFASKNLAGCGVAFYLMLALRGRLRELGHYDDRDPPNLAVFTDLVALGTVADLVPLDSNNRILVQAGLQRIRARSACAGIRALLADAGRAPERVDASSLGFLIAPRLNAAGRLDDMSIGIRCLLSDSDGEARQLATVLGDFNRERRTLQDDMQARADEIVSAMDLSQSDRLGIVVADPSWHVGVVGLVASKLTERLHRPCLALAPADAAGEDWRGSGRSVEGVHLRDVLALVDARCPGLLERFGGHAMAAGVSIRGDQTAALSVAFDAALRDLQAGVHLQRRVETDGPLRPTDLSLDLAQTLAKAGPYGQAFPLPLFDNAFDVLDRRWLKSVHLKMRLRHADGGLPVDAIWFFADEAGHAFDHCGRLRLLYQLDISDYQGLYNPQLLVRHALAV